MSTDSDYEQEMVQSSTHQTKGAMNEGRLQTPLKMVGLETSGWRRDVLT